MFKANFQTVTSTAGCLPTAFLLADRIHLLPQGLKMLASQHPLQLGIWPYLGQWYLKGRLLGTNGKVPPHTHKIKRRWRLPWWLNSNESAYQCKRHRFDPWARKIPHATKQLSLSTTAIIEPMLWSLSCHYRSPCTLEPLLHKWCHPPRWEAHSSQLVSSPAHCN